MARMRRKMSRRASKKKFSAWRKAKRQKPRSSSTWWLSALGNIRVAYAMLPSSNPL